MKTTAHAESPRCGHDEKAGDLSTISGDSKVSSAMVSMCSAPVVSGQGISAQVVSHSSSGSLATLVCRKCKLVLLLIEGDTLKVLFCKTDVLSYEAICDRWSRDRKLK